MNKLINCIECGNLCVENSASLCQACLRYEDEAEDLVAEYLRGVPRASLDEIAKATGVKTKIILRMLKRGRIVSDTPIAYPCETCGALITSGRVCADCSQTILGGPKPEERPPAREPASETSRRNERLYIQELIHKK